MPSKNLVKIFHVYSHHKEDIALKDRLDKHLRPLSEPNTVVHWDNREIMPGQEWNAEIKKHLNDADIILLLISPDFMASDDCYKQMEIALARHNKGEVRVIPIILRHVDRENVPFSHLQVLPESGKPVNSWPDHGRGVCRCQEGINRAIDEIYKHRSVEARETKRKSR